MGLFVANAYACSCGGGGAPCYNYGRSSAVFVGTPIAVRTVAGSTDRNREEYRAPRTFTFSVQQSFLGIQATEIEVSTGAGGGDCGYDFKLGTSYVVYAARYDKSSQLITSICTRTKPLDQAKEDLEFLRSLGSLSPGVTIDVSVSRAEQKVATGNPSNIRPLAQASLVIEGEGERREISTDDKGRYSLTGLPPGKFKVTLVLPDELFTHRPEEEVRITDRGCASVSYLVTDNGRLSGRVFGPEGRPAAKILLELMEAKRTDPLNDSVRYAQTDTEGRYSFDALPPGRYLLAVNLKRYPDPNDPTNEYPRTFYPGVLDMAKTEFIDVDTGEAVRDRDWQLPKRRSPSTLTGKVVWSDGTPVVKAAIAFREITYHDSKLNYGIEADESGYFTIKGYVGQIFVIEARSNRPYAGDLRRFEPMEKVDPVRIVLIKPSESLNIVITRLR